MLSWVASVYPRVCGWLIAYQFPVDTSYLLSHIGVLLQLDLLTIGSVIRGAKL